MNASQALLQSGQNHKVIRIGKRYSIETLAVLFDANEATIIAIEEGDFDFPMSTIFKLAAAINVDFRQILVDPTAHSAV